MKSIQIFNTYDMTLLEVNRSVYLSTCNFPPTNLTLHSLIFRGFIWWSIFRGIKKQYNSFSQNPKIPTVTFFYVTLYKSINKKLEILYFHFSPTFKLPIMIIIDFISKQVIWWVRGLPFIFHTADFGHLVA